MSRSSANGVRSRILIAHSDPAVIADIAFHLAQAGYGVSTAVSGPDAIEQGSRESPALVLLGTALADLSGYATLRRLRRHPVSRGIPVIVLGTGGEQSDAERAFAHGADDFFPLEPFRGRELVFRVRAILRRVRAPATTSESKVLEIGTFRLDYPTRRASIDGREVDLTPVETALLLQLAESATVVKPTREQRRRMKIAVSRLRAKLGPGCDIIETVRGSGYRLRIPPATTG